MKKLSTLLHSSIPLVRPMRTLPYLPSTRFDSSTTSKPKSKEHLYIPVDNPYTGEIIEEVPFLSKEEQMKLVLRCRQAYREHKSTPVCYRKSVVNKIVDYFTVNKEVVATDITRMMGKPITQSREEVDYAIERTKILMDMAEDALAPEIV